MTYRELMRHIAAVDFDAAILLPSQYDKKGVRAAFLPSEALLSAFKWKDTPDGTEFWNKVYEKLKEKEENGIQKSA